MYVDSKSVISRAKFRIIHVSTSEKIPIKKQHVSAGGLCM